MAVLNVTVSAVTSTVIVTAPPVGGRSGAVYSPDVEIVPIPVVAEPPTNPLTSQVTADVVSPVIVSPN